MTAVDRNHPLVTRGAVAGVIAEYDRAKGKHRENTLDGAGTDDLRRLAALVEEIGEVAELLTYDKGQHAHGRADWQSQLKAELTQVASLALTWASIL